MPATQRQVNAFTLYLLIFSPLKKKWLWVIDNKMFTKYVSLSHRNLRSSDATHRACCLSNLLLSRWVRLHGVVTWPHFLVYATNQSISNKNIMRNFSQMSRGRCLVAIRPRNTVSGGKTFTIPSCLSSCRPPSPRFSPRSPPRDAPVGVHKRHFAEPRDEPRPDQMGGPDRGRVPFPEVRGRGAAMGQEEEQQQHDLRETQPGHEVDPQTTNNQLAAWEKSLNLLYLVRQLKTHFWKSELTDVTWGIDMSS